MSIAARTQTAEQRRAIYETLTRRNRLVGILRLGLPALGAIVLAGLLLRLFLGSLGPDFGFANFAIDRDNLVVEAPSYSGVGGDGTVYAVAAQSAKAAFGDMDLINLRGASFSLRQPSGSSFEARAEDARLRLSSQIVTVDGITEIEGSNGMSGTLRGAVVDVINEKMTASGEADFTFAGGSTLKAAAMQYDGKTKRWTFERAVLHLSTTPGEGAAVRPSAAEAMQ